MRPISKTLIVAAFGSMSLVSAATGASAYGGTVATATVTA